MDTSKLTPDVINGMISYERLYGVLTLIGAVVVFCIMLKGVQYFAYTKPEPDWDERKAQAYQDDSARTAVICIFIAIAAFIVFFYPSNWNKAINPRGEVLRQLYNDSQEKAVRDAQTEMDIQREMQKAQ